MCTSSWTRPSGAARTLTPPSCQQTYTYEEVRKATDSFSKDNLLGQGMTANVYRGKLRDGLNVAVKMFFNESEVDDDTIREELVGGRG